MRFLTPRRRAVRPGALALTALTAALLVALATFVGVGALAGTTTAGRAQYAPINTAPPQISGTPRAGETLTTTTGNWSNSPTSFVYQFQRCDANGVNCGNIGKGSTNPRYTLVSADLGHRIRSLVIASNKSGSTSATSSPTGVVANQAPANTSKPVINGTPKQGQKLTVDTGKWSTPTPLTYVVQQWQRCDANGNACGNIGGAKARTYVVQAADVGHRLRVAVTAGNASGGTTALSDPTGVVAGSGSAPSQPPSSPPTSGEIKLPNGAVSVPARNERLPLRFVIDKVRFTPTRIHSRSETVELRVRVRDSAGHVVRNALVFARGVPSHRVSDEPERATGVDGWVTFTFQPQAGLPMRKGAVLLVFLRARRPNGSVLGGVSTRRLVSIRVEPR